MFSLLWSCIYTQKQESLVFVVYSSTKKLVSLGRFKNHVEICVSQSLESLLHTNLWNICIMRIESIGEAPAQFNLPASSRILTKSTNLLWYSRYKLHKIMLEPRELSIKKELVPLIMDYIKLYESTQRYM